MMGLPRRSGFTLALALPLLGGCASDVCERLVFEKEPQVEKTLVMPEGVPAVAEGGQYRVPDVAAASAAEGCQARPPMTLPTDALEPPEEPEEEEAGEEA